LMGVETTTLFFCSIPRFPVVVLQGEARCIHFPIYTGVRRSLLGQAKCGKMPSSLSHVILI
jgi:hypothetical protein